MARLDASMNVRARSRCSMHMASVRTSSRDEHPDLRLQSRRTRVLTWGLVCKHALSAPDCTLVYPLLLRERMLPRIRRSISDRIESSLWPAM